MTNYCELCGETHGENELCPQIREELKANPNLLSEAADFANVAVQYKLVASQSLDAIAKKVNGLTGANLRFEGTHQFARDIQVFKRLDTEAFKRARYFNTPDAAKSYLENASGSQLSCLEAKIVGSRQEIEWLRLKQGKLSGIIEKSSLLNKNAVGVDGEVVNRFTGENITKVSIKGASTQGGMRTGIRGIRDALKNGTLNPNETVVVPEGAKERLLKDLTREINHANTAGDTATADILTKAKENLKIAEHGNIENTAAAKDRILEKIRDGKALTSVTAGETAKKMCQGAVIGAAVGLTISCLTNYIKYKKGAVTKDEAFRDIGEDAVKGTLLGGAMAGLTLFLPGGAIGFVAGMAIGIYFNAALTNILDEIFGKGAFLMIMQASGHVLGMSESLADCINQIEADERNISRIDRNITAMTRDINANIAKTNNFLEGF